MVDMAETMIERMARELARAYIVERTGFCDHPQNREWIDEQWVDFTETAQSVLLAMREPTEAMQIVGGRIVAGLSSGRAIEPYEDDAGRAWQAMIDAALKE